jgi:hypothetical protein
MDIIWSTSAAMSPGSPLAGRQSRPPKGVIDFAHAAHHGETCPEGQATSGFVVGDRLASICPIVCHCNPS